MNERLARRLLRLPEALTPPPESGPSLEVFQPSRQLYRLELLRWSVKQAIAVIGIGISVAIFRGIGLPVLNLRFLPDSSALIDVSIGLGSLRFTLGQLFVLIEAFAILTFLVQLVVSWALLQLGWSMRWYMVSDESLRLREGVFRIREQTMTVANIQNMEVRRGPLQGLFGIADLEIHTAGGGSKAGERDDSGAPKGIHIARFRGLEDAAGLRDRLRKALEGHHGAGLGDPQDRDAPAASPDELSALASAAESLRAEARLLRHVFERSGSSTNVSAAP